MILHMRSNKLMQGNKPHTRDENEMLRRVRCQHPDVAGLL